MLAQEVVRPVNGMEVVLISENGSAVGPGRSRDVISEIAGKRVRRQELKAVAESLVQTCLQRIKPARALGFGKVEIGRREALERGALLNVRKGVVDLATNRIFRAGNQGLVE